MSAKYPGNFITDGAPAGYSVAFDGTANSYLTTPDNTAFDLGSGDFVVECWVYLTATTDYGVLLGQWGIPRGYALRQRAGKIAFVYSTNGTNETELSSTTSYALNTWYYVAAVRTSNTLGLFINSTREASASMSGVTINNSTDIFSLGRAGNAADYTTGYISNARVIKGTVPTGYSATATSMNTPTQLFPVTNTSILTCQNPTIIDNSTNAFTITAGSGTKVSNFTPFAAYTGFNPALGAAAPGVWTLDQAEYYQGNRLWPIYDPYFKNTTLLLNGNGTNGAQNNTFLDSSTNNFTITRNGNTTQGTFSPFSQTGWSNYFGGSDYLTTNSSATFGISGDFTYEGWVYVTSTSTQRFIMPSSNSMNLDIVVATGSNMKLQFYDGTTAYTDAINTFPINTWTHVALVRSGSSSNNCSFYVNGIRGTQFTATATNGTVSIDIARWTTQYYYGYISNLRFCKSAVYSGTAFKPSTSALTPTSQGATNCVLLTCQSNRFIDSSATSATLTASGSPSVQAFSPFVPAYITPTTYSNWFNKSTGYLTVPSNTAFNFSTGDFTIECWVWFNQTADAGGGGQCVVSGTTAAYPVLYISTNGGTTLSFAQNSSLIASGTIVKNAWNHVAVSRSGSSLRFFVGGILAQTATYSTAIDFGGVYIGAQSVGGVIGFIDGAISNLRILKGTAQYTANFTPPIAPLTNITNTSLLTCQSSTNIDNSSNAFTITAVGTTYPVTSPTPFPAKVDTTTLNSAYSTTLVGGSAYFDGSGDSLSLSSTSLNLGSSDFTIETWVYATTTQRDTIIGSISDGGGVSAWMLMVNEAGYPYRFYCRYNSGSTLDYLVGSGNFPVNQWTHFAVTRNGANTRIFINGIQIGTTNTTLGSSSIDNATAPYYFGRTTDDTANFTGYLSGTRVVVGTALYTQNFAPAVVPPTAITNTRLLTNFTNGGIIDGTSKNVLETVGNAQISTTQSKWGGGAIYFDGTGDYLTVPFGQNVVFNSGNFTIEGWVYATSTSARQSLFCSPVDSGYNGIEIDINAGNFEITASVSVGTWAILFATAGAISATTWTHFALVRNGTNLTMYVNGTQTYTSTALGSNALVSGSTPATISLGRFGTDTRYLNGYIDDLRITKGYARYVTNFTPPTSQLQQQ